MIKLNDEKVFCKRCDKEIDIFTEFKNSYNKIVWEETGWCQNCIDEIINTPLNLDFQIELFKRAPINIKFILFTATPQRLDGRGLSVKGGGIAYELIEGPSIPELTGQGYLTPQEKIINEETKFSDEEYMHENMGELGEIL